MFPEKLKCPSVFTVIISKQVALGPFLLERKEVITVLQLYITFLNLDFTVLANRRDGGLPTHPQECSRMTLRGNAVIAPMQWYLCCHCFAAGLFSVIEVHRTRLCDCSAIAALAIQLCIEFEV